MTIFVLNQLDRHAYNMYYLPYSHTLAQSAYFIEPLSIVYSTVYITLHSTLYSTMYSKLYSTLYPTLNGTA